MAIRERWTLAAVAALGGMGELLRRRRSARPSARPDPPPPPPVSTQSSPGQIADLQQAFGAEMGPSGPDHADPSSG